MKTHGFETIPAWRIARLRAALRDAERRGADPADGGEDLEHRAARRRFMIGRAAVEATPTRRIRRTGKGRRFPAAKQAIIWSAILRHRPRNWRAGDKAPFGSIRRAHAEAVAGCRAAGLAPPRYRTIYVLWHRGEAPPALPGSVAGGPEASA